MLRHSDHGESSLFVPENLLREARRQKSIRKGRIPRVCLLDPDGDIVKYLVRTKRAKANRHWACYHIGGSPVPLGIGTSWTTDAPFRETAGAIRRARKSGVDCVEMEAAALYAFAQARGKKVICMAQVTNTLAQSAGDFEKGPAQGATDSSRLIEFVLRALGPDRPPAA